MLSPLSTSTSATVSAVSMFADLGVSEVSVITVICLIVLLIASNILSSSTLWNRRLSKKFDMAVFPLLVTFFCIVVFKVIEFLQP